ncbi:MAG TPA: multiheme c-type cytochrome [Terriglobales bacterium]|nr:multiheme c-type cytochrome [Terriglobales bacterium]
MRFGVCLRREFACAGIVSFSRLARLCWRWAWRCCPHAPPRRPIPVSQYSASVSATYLYRFGNDEPFQPSNAQTAHGQFIPAAAFPTAAYCGHCHAAAYKQWQDSLHRNAFREPFYQKNVKLLNDSKGIEYSRHCEGCHNPIALFSGALTPHSELTRSFDDGLTCSVCHSIVKLQPMRGNGAYVLAAPAVMTDAAGKRIPSLVPDAQILAHPDRHAHAVMQPFYRSAEYCGTCHNSNLPVSLTGHKWLKGFGTYDEWQASSYSQRSPLPFYEKPLTSCQNCHMAAEPAGPGEMAAHAGSIASHRWLGGNTAVPFYYGMRDQLQRTKDFLTQQRLAIDLFGVERPGPRNLRRARLSLSGSRRAIPRFGLARRS